jgi:hypothetical protein
MRRWRSKSLGVRDCGADLPLYFAASLATRVDSGPIDARGKPRG